MTDVPQQAPQGNSPQASDLQKLLQEPGKQVWWRRRALWATLVLLLAAGGGYYYWQQSQQRSAAPSFVTEPASKGDLTLTVTANGTLQPTRSVNIGSELSGTVLRVLVDVNDRVKRGQVLVELDTAKLNDQVLRSKAALASAQAQLAQANATVKESRAGLARLEEVAKLSGGKVPSKTELDSARAAHERAVAAEASASANVDSARASLATDETNRAKASIRSPTDGVVLTRSVDPGNAVAASLQAVTLFTVAENLSQMRLQVNVDEADVGRVKVGQPASFTVSAFPSRRFPAKITRVAYGSTITDNVVTYQTLLDVDNEDLSLRPGMTATSTITAVERKNVLLVPNTALRFSPQTSAAPQGNGGIMASVLPRMPRSGARKTATGGAAKQVWVLREGAPVAVNVTPGISDGRMTEITGGDLQEGMAVITDQRAGGASKP
ncbi:efflux RND transporter periplasmic adaptor subunit [Rhodoferax sp.]|jgi:HlyD family secretion protein|uniref:efflux RND transporter periplasmic adaptor subunit n=1 Tax=Rhodoferax sp. TaxID=50421 RepID=UPI00272935D7|nr:efflux RND transporter periplasmic adaptor subunit [Rhodoferax sp.]MDO9146025.1 efflux RND transporter periplasmic adaptor subunit [Rhodoferax sp.]MDP1528133.1 efflux RND transporter periplasmic adaptor subunit [Rhodoferax sp.]MDP1943159.1 efflux RND transporter periplasmic adaptor subunit [Rhodoferax sp.]MDP2439985.1 efflux RND transporter periplasmic adaptor subunit [Rhodoferax sp.]MDP3191937.1 efflux RND transporter periplasmic adaptor subunit [Rhodoferax sp.]